MKTKQSKNLHALIRAIESRHLPGVKKALKPGVDINAQFVYEDRWITPVGLAVIGKSVDIFKFLAEQHADLHTGANLLHLAALYDAGVEMCKLLVQHGLDVNAADNNNCTALHFAAGGENVKTVRFLVDNGADTDAVTLHKVSFPQRDLKIKDRDELTPFLFACLYDRLKIVQYFIEEQKCRINRRGDVSPLHIAAKYNATKVLAYLLKKGANAGGKDVYEKTPLHLACSSNALQAIKILTKQGANVDARDLTGATPILSA